MKKKTLARFDHNKKVEKTNKIIMKMGHYFGCKRDKKYESVRMYL